MNLTIKKLVIIIYLSITSINILAITECEHQVLEILENSFFNSPVSNDAFPLKLAPKLTLSDAEFHSAKAISRNQFEKDLELLTRDDQTLFYLISPIETRMGRVTIKVNLKTQELFIQTTNNDNFSALVGVLTYARHLIQKEHHLWMIAFDIDYDNALLKVKIDTEGHVAMSSLIAHFIQQLLKVEIESPFNQFRDQLQTLGKRRRAISHNVNQEIDRIESNRKQDFHTLANHSQQILQNSGEKKFYSLYAAEAHQLKIINAKYDQLIINTFENYREIDEFIADFVHQNITQFSTSYIRINKFLDHEFVDYINNGVADDFAHDTKIMAQQIIEEFIDDPEIIALARELTPLAQEINDSVYHFRAKKRLRQFKKILLSIEFKMECNIIRLCTIDTIFDTFHIDHHNTAASVPQRGSF